MCSFQVLTGSQHAVAWQCDETTDKLTFLRLYTKVEMTRMWANAQPDGRPAKHRWRPLFNAAKFG